MFVPDSEVIETKMTTKDIFINMQRINDELRCLMTETNPEQKADRAKKVQDIATSFATEIIDLQKEIDIMHIKLGKENMDGVPE